MTENSSEILNIYIIKMESKTNIQWKPRQVEIQGYKDTLVLGHKTLDPIIQSMLDVPFQNIDACLKQITDLQEAGCRLIRLSIPNFKSLIYAEKLITKLQNRNIPHILSADIHFSPGLAFESLSFFPKVRINPGNFVEKNQGRSELLKDKDIFRIREKLEEEFFPIVNKASLLRSVIRIGVNHGSLSDRMMQRYGDTALGMVESALEYLELADEWNFYDFVISLKSSRTLHMIEANELFVKRAMERGFVYPLHLGITEAGSGEDARIKSSLGISYLLKQGIGETIRVSLAENPVNEIPVASSIIKSVEQHSDGKEKVLRQDFANNLEPSKDVEIFSSKEKIEGLEIFNETEFKNRFILFPEGADRESCSSKIYNNKLREIIYIKQKDLFSIEQEFGQKLSKLISGLDFFAANSRVRTINQPKSSIDLCVQLASSIFNNNTKTIIIEEKEDLDTVNWLLQSAGIRSHETEFIACPGCARTLFDLQSVSEKLKKTFTGNPNLKIAIMGCIVNGPGEMADADYGYVGSGSDKIDLYKGKNIVVKGLKPEDAPRELANLIKKDISKLKYSI